MGLALKKVTPVELRSVGLDEKWLQERIKEDTSILGLGELEILSRERRQPSGGKIDFLMFLEEEDTYYEIEVMLGTLDESHIIRTEQLSIGTSNDNDGLVQITGQSSSRSRSPVGSLTFCVY